MTICVNRQPATHGDRAASSLQQTRLPTAEEAAQLRESTAVNDDPARHTAQEQRVIEEYKSSASDMLRNFIERVRSMSNTDRRSWQYTELETKTNRAQEAAAKLTGVNTAGLGNQIKGNAVTHIDKRHGANGTADHSMANIDDFSRMGYVLDNFTDARLIRIGELDAETAKLSGEFRNSDNTQAPVVQFSMPVNGTYYVVEAVPDSKSKRLAVISAYMSSEKIKGEPPAKSQPCLHSRPVAVRPKRSLTTRVLPQSR